MIPRRQHISRLLGPTIVTLVAALPLPGQIVSGVARGGGTIEGTVTARGANGETIKAANVLVQLWTTDSATDAAREAACAGWTADKRAWLQAKEEIESPSGMSISGTPAGHDVELLRALMSMRRDTARSDANGMFTLNNVPYGAYTLDADVFANEKFLQWSSDVAVLPSRQAHVQLDAASLAENQYCSISSDPRDATRIYDPKDLDQPLQPLGNRGHIADNIRNVRPGTSVTIGFVVNEAGLPDMKSVTVSSTGSNVAIADAEKAVAAQRFAPPTVHGRPVKVRTGIVVTGIMIVPK